MAKLLWDQVGQRVFETGIDRGVLYLSDGSCAPWNGLTSVSEDLGDQTTSPLFIDGVKYGDSYVIGDFSASMNAVTYPDKFRQFEGVSDLAAGLSVTNQRRSTFGLSYRTRVGNDTDGSDHAYKIHILYNLTATIDDKNYQTMDSNVTPIEFSWKISGVPQPAPGYRPTAHVIFDTRYLDDDLLEVLEDLLYGSDTTAPTLPSITYLLTQFYAVVITDNGNGTWSATGPSDRIVMLTPTTFQIIDVDGTYLDPDTYTIQSTR